MAESDDDPNSDVSTPAPDVAGAAGAHVAIETAETLWRRSKDHKLIQWALAYVGAALAIAHGQELMATAFEWPHAVGRVVMVLLVLGLPLALTLAWYHGHKGLKRFSAGEATIIALLLLIGAGGFLVLVRPQSAGEQAERPREAGRAAEAGVVPATGKPRIAILPFENLSPDPANAFFTDGMQEEIISTLANRAPGLEVIARSTMMLYRTSPKSVAEVARELGATHVLEGSVRRDGDSMRLTLQLIDGSTQGHLWSESYDRTLTNALTLQTEVAGTVTSRLAVQFDARPSRPGPPTRNPEAYDLYLKARLGWQLVSAESTVADYEAMDRLLTQAIAKDPDFGAAYLERAIRNTVAYSVVDSRNERLSRAREDLATARRLLGDDPNVLGAEALLNLSSLSASGPQAAAAFQAAETAGMTDGSLFIAEAYVFSVLGRYDESQRILERLLSLDPGNLNVLGNYQRLLQVTRKPNEALRILDITIERFKMPLTPIARARVIFNYTGRTDALRAALDRYGPALEPGLRLWREFDALRFEHSYQKLQDFLAASPLEAVRPSDVPMQFVVPEPLAGFRGWAALLLGAAVAAKTEGAAVLDFASKQSSSGALRVPVLLLEAEGHLFAGNEAKAVAAAKEQLAMVPPGLEQIWSGSAIVAARVFAWAGEQDEAVNLLERLATSAGGLAPAEIARDPIFTIPLADHPRYQALKARLEAQMATTHLE
jgi:TolB-like protein/tetratricopeptide (TPR) repeat protein